jgi:hypothetical protein
MWQNFFISRMSLISLALGLSSCAQAPATPHTQQVSIQSDFSTYVDSFVADSVIQNHPVVIQDLVITMVPELQAGVGGLCTTGTNITPTIQIAKIYWDDIDSEGKEELLFHEMGHCVLNRVHDWTVNNQVPVSIMSPAFFGSALYVPNKAQYLYELFSQENLANAFPMVLPPNTAVPVLTETSE